MVKQIAILTFILSYCLLTHGQTEMELEKNSKSNIQVDTTNIAILPLNTIQYRIFEDAKPTNLTKYDIISIEKILSHCILDYNVQQEKKFIEFNENHPDYNLDKNYFIIDLDRYKRQYVAIINSKGEKEVWINCFCIADSNWKTDLIIVADGGNCFFNLKINLTTENYRDFYVNGDA